MLETRNSVRKYTHICSFRKYTFQQQDSLNFADVSNFLVKNSIFLKKIVPLLKAIVRGLCQRFFSSVFRFCKIKGIVNENVSFTDSAFGIPLQDCSKYAKNQKNDNDVTICRHDAIVNFLTLSCFSCQVQLVVQVSWEYRHWFWSYDNLHL